MTTYQPRQPPTPILVVHDGRWVAGWLHTWQRDPDRGWRALVEYEAGVGSRYYHWRPAKELQPASLEDS